MSELNLLNKMKAGKVYRRRDLSRHSKSVDREIDIIFRNPVIGRKTWYGNHSERGARTTAMLFSLVESCKLNNVNPRKYFKKLVEDLHQGKPPYTPATYASNVG